MNRSNKLPFLYFLGPKVIRLHDIIISDIKAMLQQSHEGPATQQSQNCKKKKKKPPIKKAMSLS